MKKRSRPKTSRYQPSALRASSICPSPDVTRNLGRAAAGGDDDAFAVLRQHFLIDTRAIVEAFQLRDAGELQQVLITRLILRQQQQVIRAFVFLRIAIGARAAREVALHADDGLDARLLGRVEEIDHAVHHAVIGDRHGGLAQFFGALDDRADFAQAVQHRIFTMHVKMNK